MDDRSDDYGLRLAVVYGLAVLCAFFPFILGLVLSALFSTLNLLFPALNDLRPVSQAASNSAVADAFGGIVIIAIFALPQIPPVAAATLLVRDHGWRGLWALPAVLAALTVSGAFQLLILAAEKGMVM